MHKHILIPTDGSELSQKAIDYGMALAKSVNAKVTVMTVSTPFHALVVEPGMITDTPEQYGKRMATLAAEYLNVAKEAALAAGVSCDMMHVEHDQPYLAIIDTATRKSCDLIVMASHGRRGISAIVLGSEAVKVLTHSTIPVLVFRTPHPPFFIAS
jgi:nucleotide-binding universal stress UspA family protein